ncbi:MAG: hypothetical protein QXK88_02085 [Desulfurococcaceae archaeon]
MNARKYTTLLLVACLIFTLAGTFASFATVAQSSGWVLESSSFRSTNGGDVYPGSRNARLTVITRYIGSEEAVSPVGCLVGLPQGFQPLGPACVAGRDANNTVVSAVKEGAVIFFSFNINVDRRIAVGNYSSYLNISYYVAGEVLSEVIEVGLTLSDYPPMLISVEDAYLAPYSYPGACPVNTLLRIKNSGTTSITNMRATLNLPQELVEPSEVNYTYAGTLNPGESVYLNLGGICVSPSAYWGFSGLLSIKAQLVTSDGVVYDDESEAEVWFNIGEEPTMKLYVLDYGLTSGSTLPGFKNTGIKLLVRSEEPSVLRISHSVVELEKAYFTNGSSSATFTNNVVLNYLDSALLTYNGVNIEEGARFISAYITLYGSANRGGTEYPVALSLYIVISLESRDLSIHVAKVSWGRSYAYPGSSGNTLIIAIRNSEAALSLSDAIVEVALSPESAIYPDRLIASNVALNPGSLVEVYFQGISIPNTTAPGAYDALIRITGVLRGPDGSFRYTSLHRDALVVVEDASKLTPVLPVFNLVDVFWGEISPQHVYPGNSRAPLTITVQNNGTFTALNTLLLLESASSDVKLLSRGAQCAVRLSPGDQCSGVFYLDLSNASSGLMSFNLTVKYVLQELGVETLFTQEMAISLYLPAYPAGTGLVVSSSGWLNNNPAFPNSKGAILSITLANLEPYPVYSTWARLEAPTCMAIHNGTQNTAYIAGPVASLQTATISFALDLNNCNSGVQVAELELDYYVQTTGGGVRRKLNHTLPLFVDADEGGLDYVLSGWVNTPLVPPVYGAYYYVVLRNNLFPQVNNPVLRLYLPEGVVESKSNSREPVIMPASRLTAQQAFVLQSFPGGIASLIEQLLPQLSQPQVTSTGKGEFVVYMFQLNVERADIEEFSVPFVISFIDHWGHEYKFSSSFTVKVLKAPPLLEVRPASHLIVFNNGTAILDVHVVNNYSASVYNLYVALVPVSGNAIPQNAIKYIEKLEGRSNTTLRYTLIYNPVQITIGSVPVAMTSAVFTVTLIYVDTAGGYHSMNTTLAAMVSPFIELAIMPGIAARHTGSTLIVNGVLANTGLTSAKSVVIYLKYAGRETLSIIGDIDPASQTPFRVEMATPYVNKTCTVVVRYRDEYGSEYAFERELEITVQPEAPKTTPPPAEMDSFLRLTIIVIVCLFLVGVFLVIYRYVRKYVGEGRA